MGRPKKALAPLPPIWRLSDQQWALVEPVLAEYDPPALKGPDRVDQRAVMDAVIFRLRTGCQWNRLPQEYPDDSTVHRQDQPTLTRRGAFLGSVAIEELRGAVAALLHRDAHDLRAEGVGGTCAERFLDALTAIVAWAAEVRGTRSVVGTIEVARCDEEMPRVLRLAWQQVVGVDLEDLAGDLLNAYRPKAAIERIRQQFDDRQQTVLCARPLAVGSPRKFADLAAEIGVREDAAKKLVQRAEARLKSVLDRSEFQLVHRAATSLRSNLGAACPLDAAPVTLSAAFGDQRSAAERFATCLLLALAGPYELVDDWLVQSPATDLIARTTELVTAATAQGAVPVAEVEGALDGLEIKPEHRARWIVRLESVVKSVKVMDDFIMRHRSLADRAEAVLLAHGKPMSRDELSSQIDVTHDVSSLVDQLRLDSRFRRTGSAQYGLTSWPDEQYVPIIEQVVLEIERSGGEAEIERLIPALAKKGDVREATVRIAVSLRDSSGHVQDLWQFGEEMPRFGRAGAWR